MLSNLPLKRSRFEGRAKARRDSVDSLHTPLFLSLIEPDGQIVDDEFGSSFFRFFRAETYRCGWFELAEPVPGARLCQLAPAVRATPVGSHVQYNAVGR